MDRNYNTRLTPEEFQNLSSDEAQEDWINEQLYIAEHAEDSGDAEIAVQNIGMAAKFLAEQEGSYGFAADILIELIELDIEEASVNNHASAAKFALKDKDTKQALQATHAGLARWPKSKTILAQHILALGRYGTDEALKQRDIAVHKAQKIKLGKDDSSLAMILGEYFCNEGNPDRALEIINPVLDKIISGRTDFEDAKAIAAMGIALLGDEERKNALRSVFQGKYTKDSTDLRLHRTDVFAELAI